MKNSLAKSMLIVTSLVMTFALSLNGASAAPKEPASAKKKVEAKQSSQEQVDLNSASQTDLEKLPGIGAATAKKIIVGRPYTTVADLSKAGVAVKTIEKITPLVTVRPAAMPKAATPKAGAVVAPATAKPAKTVQPTKTVQPPPGGKNMVWVNSDSKVFHRSGSHWYGKTKQGSYMTEAEAVKAGYRESK